ncbi:PAS domain-containing protein, partial [uncultured Roseibium sp.]|uniref:PAS domain-containing hybrid sensor histidine kinase/response regulator n=1 Tax=uncultured Roseibium sp. TaxID=1936171 RepID=UPI003217D986
RPIDWIYRMRHADGRWLWLLSRTTSASELDSGRPTCLIITHCDITEQKKARAQIREEERRATFALDNANQAIWDLDFQQGKTFYSPTWKAMLGYGEEEISSDTEAWMDLIHPDDREAVLQADRAHKEGRTPAFEAEFRMRHKNGEWIWVLDRGKVVSRDEDGNPLRMIGTHSDITHRKRTEAELKEARDAAEAASRAKTDFLANMSHELRTPLTSILGVTDLILSELGDRLSERHLSALKIQKAAGDALMAQVNDILDFAKLEGSRLKIETVSLVLADLADACLAIVANAAEAGKLSLTRRLDPALPQSISGDPRRLRQILINFLSNAIKFTPEGGKVVLEISKEPNSHIRFAVADTGIGIPEDQVATIFERFTQADTSITRRHEGSGLGLAISKSLVDLMGGTIGVRTAPDAGSTFYFTLPLQGSEAGSPQAPHEAKDGRLIGTRVLLAEDNDVNRRLIRLALEAEECIVTDVADGRAAVAAMENAGSDGFDVILMDIQMPQLDGGEASHLIRGMPGGRTIPIIALTANVYASEQEQFRPAAFDAWLAKPVDWSQLFGTMAGLMTSERPHPDTTPGTPSHPADEGVAEAPIYFEPEKPDDLINQFGPQETARLIRMLEDEMTMRIATMQAPEIDLATIRVEAHTLSSSAGTLGCREVYRLCRDLMAAAKRDRSETLALVGELAESIETTRHCLADYVAQRA